MRDKIAAAQLKDHLLYGALMRKTSSISMKDIQRAMQEQRSLHQGSSSERIGSNIEQRRREGALAGSVLGGLAGGLVIPAAVNPKSKALMALLALGGVGAGGAAGNLIGRAGGVTEGALEGLLATLPGVRSTADFLAQPLIDD